MRRLGVSSCFYEENRTVERWSRVVEAGIGEAELIFEKNSSIEMILSRAEMLFSDLTNGGFAVTSVHLPFDQFWDLSSRDEELREKAKANFKELIAWTGKKGIKCAVIHPSYEPISVEERPVRLATAIQEIKEIGDFAKSQNVILAVENLPRTCLGNTANDMLLLTNYGKNASICFDANHLLIESHKDFLDKVAPYIVTTHLSDYDRINERHWLVGDGIIDWKELVSLLDESGYQGNFLFELGESSSPKQDGSFTPLQLVERFQEIIR